MSYKKVPAISACRGIRPPHSFISDPLHIIGPNALREFNKAMLAAYPNVKFKLPIIYGTPEKNI